MDKENNLSLSEEEKIEQENLLLQSEIILRGGIIGDSNNIPSEIENQFLKNILAFENAEMKPLDEITGIKRDDYPVSNELTDNEIDQKLDQIIDVLNKNGIELGLVSDVPNKIVYKYLVEDYLFDSGELYPVGIGAIASYLGSHGSARMVGWAMNSSKNLPQNLPAHRVVNRNGLLTGKQHFGGNDIMADLLRSEGLLIEENKILNFAEAFWNPSLEL